MGAKGTPVYLTDKEGGNELDITANGEIQVVGSITPSGTQDVDVIGNTIGLATEATAADIKTGTDKIPSLGQAVKVSSAPVVIASDQGNLSVDLKVDTVGIAKESGGNLDAMAADLASLDGKVPATPATEDGNLAVIAGDTTSLDAKVPGQGQALKVASLPVVIASDQGNLSVDLITDSVGLAKEAGGNLAGVKTNTDKIPSQGEAAMVASTPVVIANDQTSVPTKDDGFKTQAGENDVILISKEYTTAATDAAFIAAPGASKYIRPVFISIVVASGGTVNEITVDFGAGGAAREIIRGEFASNGGAVQSFRIPPRAPAANEAVRVTRSTTDKVRVVMHYFIEG